MRTIASLYYFHIVLLTTLLGILNLTPDSFSDGGRYTSGASALKQAERMRSAGANIIDVGGESTRPGAKPVGIAEELRRVLPVVKKLKAKKYQISLDSRRPDVVEECLPYIDWINDVEGLSNPLMRQIVALSGKKAILMHSRDVPVRPDKKYTYKNVVTDLCTFFTDRIQVCESAGIKKSQLMLDPGIGFGKSLTDNLRLLARLDELMQLGLPVVLGASRKSFIGKLDESAADERLGGSIAAVLAAYSQGVRIFRVHDVAETKQALMLIDKINGAGYTS